MLNQVNNPIAIVIKSEISNDNSIATCYRIAFRKRQEVRGKRQEAITLHLRLRLWLLMGWDLVIISQTVMNFHPSSVSAPDKNFEMIRKVKNFK